MSEVSRTTLLFEGKYYPPGESLPSGLDQATIDTLKRNGDLVSKAEYDAEQERVKAAEAERLGLTGVEDNNVTRPMTASELQLEAARLRYEAEQFQERANELAASQGDQTEDVKPLTLDELKDVARANDFQGFSNMNRDDLESALQDAGHLDDDGQPVDDD